MEATYVVKEASGFRCKETFLHDIAGASLRGKVIGVEGEKVQVHLDIDEDQDAGGAYWFPFSTLQSSSDGSGWYYMPENGDCVDVDNCRLTAKEVDKNVIKVVEIQIHE